jgi:hypothetical protein
MLKVVVFILVFKFVLILKQTHHAIFDSFTITFIKNHLLLIDVGVLEESQLRNLVYIMHISQQLL